MAMPPVDPGEEFERRLAAAKRYARLVLELNKLMCEVDDEGKALTLAVIAERLGMSQRSVVTWCQVIGWAPRPNGKPRKRFEAMPWRRAVRRREAAW
jgi:hypothetical protein